jgi:hypothetical protein
MGELGGTNRTLSACSLVVDRLRTGGLWRTRTLKPDGKRCHLVSPEPFTISRSLLGQLEALGPALLGFYIAANDLYLKGPIWVRDYLDRGKSEEIIRYSRANFHKHSVPMVIRPDVLLGEDGPFITELDSVPGGIGHLHCLSAAYEEIGFDLIGSPNGMRNAFAEAIRGITGLPDPACAIVVSDESEDYRPEMNYLAEQLRSSGFRAFCVHPREVVFSEEGLFVCHENERVRLDLIYRFFELFDLPNVPKAELIAYAAKKRTATITPPFKHHLEEKLLLALLHHAGLSDYWSYKLGEESFELLRRVIAPTFVLDNRPVPPHAEISGFWWRDKPLRDWRELATAGQRERRLVIKPSGYSPLAWGSRGVKVGHDLSQDAWAAALSEALDAFDHLPYVLQPFCETSLSKVRYQDTRSEEVGEMEARVRLCPYYFVVDGQARLAGVLATACPKDKKLIHGMEDAVMAPCRLAEES